MTKTTTRSSFLGMPVARLCSYHQAAPGAGDAPVPFAGELLLFWVTSTEEVGAVHHLAEALVPEIWALALVPQLPMLLVLLQIIGFMEWAKQPIDSKPTLLQATFGSPKS